MTTLAGLLERLRTMGSYPHKPYPTHYVNPDGPDAAKVIEDQAGRIAVLEELVSKAAHLLADLSPGFIWESEPYKRQAEERDALVAQLRAALTLKENDDG